MFDIIYRGTLTLTKLKELAKEHGITGSDYALTRAEDGNWVCTGTVHGKTMKVRSWDPIMALQGLLSGQGEIV
jgi:hypothetical protein